MENRKKLFSLGVLTYILSILLFLTISFVIFILLPKISDWELFSFNLYGGLLFYGLAILPYSLFASFVKLDKVKSYIIIVVLLFSTELVALVISGKSILLAIITSMVKDENYILLAYPLVLIMSYFIIKRILRISF